MALFGRNTWKTEESALRKQLAGCWPRCRRATFSRSEASTLLLTKQALKRQDFLQALWSFLQQPAAAVIVAVAVPIVSALVTWYIRRRHRAAQREEEVEEQLVSQVNPGSETVTINPVNVPAG